MKTKNLNYKIGKALLLLTFCLGLLGCQKKDEAASTKFVYAKSTAHNPANVAAKIGKVEISWDLLNKGIAVDTYELEQKIFDLRMNRLRAMALEKLMDQHPGRQGLTNDQFLDKYISKNKTATDSEVDDFINQRGIPKENLNPSIRDKIRSMLLS